MSSDNTERKFLDLVSLMNWHAGLPGDHYDFVCEKAEFYDKEDNAGKSIHTQINNATSAYWRAFTGTARAITGTAEDP